MDLNGTKLVVLFVLTIIKLISGILPYFLLGIFKVNVDTRELLDNVIYGVTSYGGGVLFAVVVLHMLPEARESLNTAREQFEEVIKMKYILPCTSCVL